MELEFRSVLGRGSRIEVFSVDNIDTVKLGTLLILPFLEGVKEETLIFRPEIFHQIFLYEINAKPSLLPLSTESH